MSRPAKNRTPRPCACTTVRTTSRLLARTYDAALQGSGLNVKQLAVLRAIDRMAGEPLSRVADALSMDRTSLYRAVATMEKPGWVALESGIDGRSRSASIGATGRRILEQADPRWERVQSDLIGTFGRERWRKLVAELEALADSAADLDIDEIASSTRGNRR